MFALQSILIYRLCSQFNIPSELPQPMISIVLARSINPGVALIRLLMCPTKPFHFTDILIDFFTVCTI